jgi:hypothetical protein
MAYNISNYNEEELPERIADRVMFLADLLWEVIPNRPERAKRKEIVFENAENFYERNRQRFLDDEANAVLTATPKNDYWVRSSYINNYFVDIKDYLMASGKIITYRRGKGGGIYKSNDIGDMEKMHEFKARVMKKQADKLTYRAILWQKATGEELPGVVTQILQLEYGT